MAWNALIDGLRTLHEIFFVLTPEPFSALPDALDRQAGFFAYDAFLTNGELEDDEVFVSGNTKLAPVKAKYLVVTYCIEVCAMEWILGLDIKCAVEIPISEVFIAIIQFFENSYSSVLLRSGEV